MGFSTLVTVALTLSAALNGVIAAKPSSGCGKNAQSGTSTIRTTVNGRQRNYIVNIPNNYKSSQAHRLMFMFHGAGNSASAVAYGQQGFLPFMGLPPLANGDKIGAISVAPDGLNSAWSNSGGEDIAFVDQMIKEIESRLCIDQNLRFSTGFSFGASMTYAIACARAKQFRAVALISGAQISGCSGGNDPIAFYSQHGVTDATIPYNTGKQLRDHYVRVNGCQQQNTVDARNGGRVVSQYKGCKSGYPMTWVSFDGGHTSTPLDYSKGEKQSFTPVETWKFFKQFA